MSQARILTKSNPQAAHCHELIAETAQAMAHEVWDELATRDDNWLRWWKSQHPGKALAFLEKAWVASHWARFIPGARAILAGMLANPIDETQKTRIHEALVLDSTLKRGRSQG